MLKSSEASRVSSHLGVIEWDARPRFRYEAAAGKRISLEACVVCFFVLDVSILAFGGLVVDLLMQSVDPGAYAALDWPMAITAAISLYIIAARACDVYQTSEILRINHVIMRVPLSLAVVFVSMFFLGAAVGAQYLRTGTWLFLWAASCASLILIERAVILEQVQHAFSRGAHVFKAFSIGVKCAPISANEIAKETNREVFVCASRELDYLSDLADLADFIVHEEIDQVYIAAPWEIVPKLLRNLHLLHHLSTRVIVIPGPRSAGAQIASVTTFCASVALQAVARPIDGWSLWFKRASDVALALGGLVALSPLLLLTALAIRLESVGPILFVQNRVGFNGRVFSIYKFRSMYAQRADLDAAVQTSRGDPRVTRVGKFIRRLSIDELPQLLNVLQGSMSIVGPRPHALGTRAEGRKLDELIEYYAARHKVKPGLTGWAQIHGLRGELDSIEKLHRRVDYDIEYINNWSLLLDIKVILKTVAMVLRDKAAY